MSSTSSWRMAAALGLLVGMLSSCRQTAADPPATQGSSLSSYEAYIEASEGLFTTDEELIVAIEEGIADCMKDGGFEYVPFPDQYLYTHPPTDTPSSDSLERSQLRKPAFGRPDPNEAIVAALDSETRSAYTRRLWGTSDQISDTLPEGGVASMDLSVTAIGCQNYVGIELRGGASAYEDETKLLEFSSALERRVTSHERFIAAEQAFERCLQESDFLVVMGDFEELSGDVSEMDPEEDAAAFASAMTHLRDVERQVAAAEDDCNDEAAVDDVAEQLRSELFQEVVEGFG